MENANNKTVQVAKQNNNRQSATFDSAGLAAAHTKITIIM